MSYEQKRVLVTGADGFIGSHLTEALARTGAAVTGLCLYNSFDSHGWLDEIQDGRFPNLVRVRGDVRDASFVRNLVAGHDTVFHLAALIAIPYSYVAAQSYVETNVLGTLNVLEAARACGVKRMVHTSTSEVYGSAITVPIGEAHPLQGQSPYSASKIGADMMVQAFVRSFDLPVAVLRPFNTFGPRQSERAVIPTIIRQMLDPDCGVVKVGDLSTIRDFTFVDDTVAAFLTLGLTDKVAYGQAYNAGSGKAVTIAETLDLLAGMIGSGKPVRQEDIRLRPSQSEVLALLANADRLAADTGWRPRVTLREGLERTVAWWRERFAEGRVRRASTFMV
ncbi:MAG: SDR family NAD(P)-dependent oxidoreductase [Rhodospirillales bacterium]|nr:SDR family NAD(P)-dependent oxidoreductase [Rhodospirillales bacterium]